MARKVQFSDKTVYSIINEVKQHPVLWNIDHEYYNLRFRTAAAWQNIAASLELPENVLRAKWKNIRDTYKKEIKKFKIKTVDEYNGKWQFFNDLKFLKFSDVTWTGGKDSEDSIELVVIDEFKNQNYEHDDPLQEEDANKEKYVMKPNNSKENYDVMFLKSLVPYFKELNPVRKLVMRNKIQELLINEITVGSKQM